jgi:hypothetical protein
VHRLCLLTITTAAHTCVTLCYVHKQCMTGLLIVLVLMILTVDINIAGPSITLNSTQYGTDSDVIIGGTNADTAVYPAFTIAKKDKFEWITADQLSSIANYAANSTVLSQYMLDTYSNHSDKDIRFAAYIFGDVIPLNLTVDWPYVKDNIQFFTDIVAQVTGGDLTFGNELIDYQSLLRTSNITEAILQQQLETVLANTNGTVIPLNQTRADIVNYLIEQFGFTIDQAKIVADTVIEARDAAGTNNSNSINSNSTVVNSTALAEYIAGRLNNSDVTFFFDAATLDADTLDITLTNVTASTTSKLQKYTVSTLCINYVAAVQRLLILWCYKCFAYSQSSAQCRMFKLVCFALRFHRSYWFLDIYFAWLI